jgi:hypothetical protein
MMITVKQLEAQLRRRINATAKTSDYLAVGGPLDGKILPLTSPDTLIGLWRVDGHWWYGRYQYYNEANHVKPVQAGRGLPLVFWRTFRTDEPV